MNKIFTVISLLLFVAFANSTKRVSYSDLVSSLAQVTHVEGADAIIDAVRSSWGESLQNLQKYNQALANQCSGILTRANEKAENYQKNLQNIVQSIQEIQDNTDRLQNEVNGAQEEQQRQQSNIQALRDQVQNENVAVQQRVLAVVERDRVFRRLTNLIEDQLVGHVRQSQMGGINVNREASGFTFLEVHNQLKGLNASDPVVKSMISTLVLITQDQNGLFSSQETVARIRGLIENIVKKDRETVQRIREESANKIAELRRGISEASDAAQRFVESVMEKRANIVRNAAVIKFSRNAQKGMEGQMRRAMERKNSNINMCKKVQDLNRATTAGFQEGVNRFAALRRLVADE